MGFIVSVGRAPSYGFCRTLLSACISSISGSKPSNSQNAQSAGSNPAAGRTLTHKSTSTHLYLLALVLPPHVIVKFFVKRLQLLNGEEIDEPVPHIALILHRCNCYVEVTGKVKKVVAVSVSLVDFLRQLTDGVFVGDISDHDGGSKVVVDVVELNGENVGICPVPCEGS